VSSPAPPPPGSPRPTSPRPTSHRAASPAAQLIRRATPPLAAVTAVVAVVVILLVLNSRPSASGPAPGAVAEQPASASTTPPTGSPAPSASPSPSESTAPGAPPVSQPPATQPPATTEAAKLPVTVLNNSRRSHLAAHVAAELAAKGWPIRKTGNFTGRIRASTVYYAPGQRAAAERLAREFGEIRRVEPRFRGLPGVGLTVVVTRDWSA